jgi:gas vesicle protein
MNENNGKLLFAVLAGGAVGFALGMLLAPQKGTDLRQNIVDSLDDIGEKVNSVVSEGRERLMEVAGMASGSDNVPVKTSLKKGANPSSQAVS